MNEKVNIYQIYYLEQQKAILDPAFIPYDNSNPPFGQDISNKIREWPIIRRYGLEKAIADNASVWGFVSYKFQEKTNTTGQQFVNFIKNNPDNEVWFMEPVYKPQNPFFNPWIQGDVHHPSISFVMNSIFEFAGSKVDVKQIPMPFCWYNFFAGTKKFWNLYFQIMDEIIQVSKNHSGLNQVMFETGAGHGNDPTVPYFIFIAERMFPTILALTGIKYAGMPYEHADFVFG